MESPWGVLVWNMARGATKRGTAADTWAYLAKLTEGRNVRVALLNEADVYSLQAANNAAIRDGEPEPAVFSEVGTQGRDFWDKDGVRSPYDRSAWSAAVLASSGPEVFGERDVRAVSSSGRRRSPDIPFTNSRPGSWIAASVTVGSEKLTCVSLYGLIEELSDASMHRSLSEISPLFSDPRYNELVLLGGDFNTSTATDAEHRECDRIVLDRIKAYGLHDCLAEWREKNDLPRLEGCACDDAPCRHTLTRLTPNRVGKERPWQERVSKQVDYLFASETLASRVDDVVEIEPEEWEVFSDHRPIIVTFTAEEPRDGSEGPRLDPECQRRIASTRQPEAVRLAMEELLLGLRSSFPGSEVVPGHEKWQVVELHRGGRVIVRVFPKDGLVKVENLSRDSKPGDYGPDLDLRQQGGEWACKLSAAGAPDELLLCVKDAVEGIAEGRRRAGGLASSGTRGVQAETWRRSSIRPSLRFQVLLRDDYTCQYCGRSAPEVVLHVDHRTPVSLGGSDAIENLVTACADCNQGKGNRHVT